MLRDNMIDYYGGVCVLWQTVNIYIRVSEKADYVATCFNHVKTQVSLQMVSGYKELNT